MEEAMLKIEKTIEKFSLTKLIANPHVLDSAMLFEVITRVAAYLPITDLAPCNISTMAQVDVRK
eukprot:snap_masked-scaffold_14-processed-gene-3.25-mRNA-1 protein AED:1.00 eAED:1.00 QI:0/0/0/0/1/1/2/0/63